ncbi:MAG TPA: SDR family NAD(P)-dependent oxidoreductase [Solirubrobacterales bacterium]|nr:SDR family NAD(P)-dependent oxidoreductase [Solirubrobacterales bacterium]
MDRFKDKTAIVTGGSKGLGRTIAGRLAAEGAEVLVTGRGEEDLKSAVAELEQAGGRAWWLSGDVADPAACEGLVAAALERWGRIDVLVNNAGVFDEAELLEIELENWDFVLDVMLKAPFVLSRAAARSMIENGGGAIVSLSSIDGHDVDGPFTSYSVAKAGLMQLTKNIAVELGAKGVRANTVSPGWALTPMVEAATAPDELEMMKNDFRRVPMKRMVMPEEVAAAVCFLASDEASGITGTDLVVDCGTIADLYILPTLESGGGAKEQEAG